MGQSSLPMSQQSVSNISFADRHGPLLFSFALLAVILVWLTWSVVSSCGGHFGYPMDDTYIHMAMAKTFSQHHVWGLTRYGFSSSSSSLLYTFLLSAVYWVTGPTEIAPFALNVIFAFALIALVDLVLRADGVEPRWRAVALFVIVLGMPLGPETVAGMEHVLQSLLDLAFVFLAVRILANDAKSTGLKGWLLLLSPLIVLARYESLALVVLAGTGLLLRRRWRLATAVLLLASIPIGVFGAYSVMLGWFPVPNSVVAKASRPEKSAWPYPLHWAEQMSQTPAIAFLGVVALLLLVCLYAQRRSIWSKPFLTVAFFAGALLFHAQFGRFGWFFRYEAYLIVLGIYACAVALHSLELRVPYFRLAVALMAALTAASFYTRSIGALWLTPRASRNIHEQQYQMGRFLQEHYNGETVLLNDIGAAGFLSDARIVDLYGLSTIEVARAKVHHAFTREFREQLARKTAAKIAILYPAMYQNVGGLPSQWAEIATWTIPNNQVCWSDTVSFLAVDAREKEGLETNLSDFARQLPTDVTQRGVRK